MEHIDTSPATPESVWAIIREIAASHKELVASQKENERYLTERQAETDRMRIRNCIIFFSICRNAS